MGEFKGSIPFSAFMSKEEIESLHKVDKLFRETLYDYEIDKWEEARSLLIDKLIVSGKKSEKIDKERAVNKPCPRCGSLDLIFRQHIAYGHGDCTFSGCIQCNNCGIRGNESTGWGNPSEAQIKAVWNQWNSY